MGTPVWTIPPKYLKYFFATTVLMYMAVCFFIKNDILMDTGKGFVSGPQDPASRTYLYVFSAIALVFAVLQFVIPGRIQTEFLAQTVRGALCESIGICGLLYFIIVGDLYTSLIFMGGSLLLILIGGARQSVF